MKTAKFVLSCLLFVILFSSASVARGEETWNTLVKTSNAGLCLAAAEDGSSVVGYADSENLYFTLVKLDKDGVITKTLDVKHEKYSMNFDVRLMGLAFSIEDGQNYIYVIEERAYTASTREGVVRKYDSNLNQIWMTHLNDFRSLRQLLVMNDHVFLVGLNQGSSTTIIGWTRIGFSGVVDNDYTVHSDVAGYPMKVLRAGNTAVAFGYEFQETGKAIGINLLNGQMLWNKDYYSAGTYVVFSGAEKVFTNDAHSGYVVSGYKGYNSGDHQDMLFALDLNGNIISQREYDSTVWVDGTDGYSFIVITEAEVNTYEYHKMNYPWSDLGQYEFMDGFLGGIVKNNEAYLSFGHFSAGGGTYVRYYKPDVVVVISPTASAGPDKVANEGATVSLSASGSTIGTYSVSYHWESDDVTINNPNSVGCSFTAPQVELGGDVLTFQLTVTDSEGNQSIDTVQVTVNNILKLGTVNAGADKTLLEGNSSALAITVTAGDYTVSSVVCSVVSGPVTLTNANTVNPTVTAGQVGIGGETAIVRCRVTDAGGNIVEDTVNIVINNVDQGPKAHAGTNQIVNGGDTVYLSGSVEQGDFPVANYNWTSDGKNLVLINPNSANPRFVAPQAGVNDIILNFQLVVTDSFGYSSTALTTVTVAKVVDPDPVDPPLPTIKSVTKGDVTAQYFTEAVKEIGMDFVDQGNNSLELIPGIGFLQLDVKHVVPGSTVTIKLIFKNPIPDGYDWWKEMGGDLSIYPGAVISADRMEVDLTLTDGGQGDDDGEKNGWTRDPSGPGRITQVDPEEPGVPGAEGGGGGGCFISSAENNSNHWISIFGIMIMMAIPAIKKFKL